MEKKTIWDLNRVSVDEYKSNVKKFPIVVVLDNIRSLNNVGSVFRTADAFLVSKIMLCGITAIMKFIRLRWELKTLSIGNTLILQ